MKKFLSKVGTFLGGLLGFCFVAVLQKYVLSQRERRR